MLYTYKPYYLELLRASEGTLSLWSRLHWQSLAPTLISRRVDVRQAAVVKIIAESLSQHDEIHVVPTPLSGIRVGGRKIRINLPLESTYLLTPEINNQSQPIRHANSIQICV
jgi:hypothetical protein